MEIEKINFTLRVGEKKTIPFPAPHSAVFMDIIMEVCDKFGLQMQTVSLANPSGVILTPSDLNQNVSYIVNEYGNNFDVIDGGLVGGK